MSNSAYTDKSWINYITGVVWNNKWLIILPTVLFGGLAFAYSIFKTPTWTASQSLIIRDDLVGDASKPGRFDSQESLMSAQETIQEIVGKQEVIRSVLEELGPAPGTSLSGSAWPDAETVESGQGAVSINAPGGTEFGKSEVIVLTASAATPERAMEFARLVIEELESRLQKVRVARVQSMTAERQLAVEYAQTSYDESASRLKELEASFGSDLSSVRSMTEQYGTESPLQRSLTEVRAEKRRAEAALDKIQLQHQLLSQALDNPNQLTATSSDLLQLQPRLQQLVTGLNEAEIKLATLVGRYQEKHPNLINGREAVADIKQQILEELAIAIEIASSQIQGAQQLLNRKIGEESSLEQRLSQIAGSRVDYDRLNEEVKKKSQILADARGRLSEIGSFSDAENPVALLTLVGEISVPARADGPGTKMLTAMGLAAGLFGGLGLVLLVAPPFKPDTPYEAPPVASAIARQAEAALAAGSARAGEMIKNARQKVSGSAEQAEATPSAGEQREVPYAAVVSSAGSAAGGSAASADSSVEAGTADTSSPGPVSNQSFEQAGPLSADNPADTDHDNGRGTDDAESRQAKVAAALHNATRPEVSSTESVLAKTQETESEETESNAVRSGARIKLKPAGQVKSTKKAAPVSKKDQPADSTAIAGSNSDSSTEKPAVVASLKKPATVTPQKRVAAQTEPAAEIQPKQRVYKRRPTPTSELLADKQQVLRDIESRRSGEQPQTEAGRRLEKLTNAANAAIATSSTIDLDLVRRESEPSGSGAISSATASHEPSPTAATSEPDRLPETTIDLGALKNNVENVESVTGAGNAGQKPANAGQKPAGAGTGAATAESLNQRLADSAAPSPEQIVREIRRRREKEMFRNKSEGSGERITPTRRRARSTNPFIKKKGDAASDSADQSQVPIPEQVKNLSKSIAEFCDPLKGKTPRSNDAF